MEWIASLINPESIAHSILILSLVTALGLLIGSIRVYGIELGVAGVLFSGILFAHFGFAIDPRVMEFAREFGLIIFVYTIGIQVGPGFFASFKKQGMQLSLLAGAIVFMGIAIDLGAWRLGAVPLPAAAGLLSGATTNTPSLAAAQQVLKELAGPDEAIKMVGLGYAIAYPFGVLGIILSLILLRFLFRINPQEEARELSLIHQKTHQLHTLNLEVVNPNLNNLPLNAVSTLREWGIVISRVYHEGKLQVAEPETVLHAGDTVLAVGERENLEKLRLLVGKESVLDLRTIPSEISSRRIMVSRKNALGKTLDELELLERFGVTVTRIIRAEVEFTPAARLRLQFGDILIAVGEDSDLAKVSEELGNSVKELNHPQLIPVFLGIAVGVMIGSVPLHFPGTVSPFKLGLAGGPLLVAIILSRIGSIGKLSWYMPASANFMLRELGVTLFLACVGLKSGGQFFSALTEGQGLYWFLWGAAVTILPLLTVGFFARKVLKMNDMTLSGLLAGSMTDPPALAFACATAKSDLPSFSYATVYPVVMILRILSAQAILLFWGG